MNAIDRALAHIDRMRERLREEFERDMAKLDNDECRLLGLKTEPNHKLIQTKSKGQNS